MVYRIENMTDSSHQEVGLPSQSDITTRETQIQKETAEAQELFELLGPVGAARTIAEKTITRQEQTKEEKTVLQRQADRDPYNPRLYSAIGWERVMRDKVAELKRNNKSAILITWDLDHFKDYNDLYESHAEGDKALGLAGELAKNTLRPGDIIARLHGDEFIALVETDIEGAILAANRVRSVTSELPILLETSIPLGASLGVRRLSNEIIQTEWKSDEDFAKALKHEYELADQVMYRGAKEVGGDRIGSMLEDGTIKTAIITHVEGQHPTIIYEELQATIPTLAKR